ncbi:CPBP family intramembrane glutamic endopeptidase, BDIM_20840 family [Brevundimonas sp.]|uniref:CPBP family intramembrane glutamic endopeptidase, BDIM_20840 family n=1 Tax=Brevundimonas sp. TaxID=1871086 RepID=UPI003D09C17B
MNGLIGIAGVVGILLLVGGVLGWIRRDRFSPGWLFVAAGLVMLNDCLLTNLYGLLPVLPSGDWNWQGKALALTATLGIAGLPAFGWRACGFTLRQAPDSLTTALPVALLYVALFVALGLAFPNEPASVETLAFQLTMPGLEEELFYRGLLLVVLARAFTGRVRFLGVEWGWGALLSCMLFGLAHAFGFSRGGFHFDPITMALTAIPSLIAVWLALRTRSVALPVILHNFGNAITLMI